MKRPTIKDGWDKWLVYATWQEQQIKELKGLVKEAYYAAHRNHSIKESAIDEYWNSWLDCQLPRVKQALNEQLSKTKRKK